MSDYVYTSRHFQFSDVVFHIGAATEIMHDDCHRERKVPLAAGLRTLRLMFSDSRFAARAPPCHVLPHQTMQRHAMQASCEPARPRPAQASPIGSINICSTQKGARPSIRPSMALSIGPLPPPTLGLQTPSIIPITAFPFLTAAASTPSPLPSTSSAPSPPAPPPSLHSTHSLG